MEDLIQKVRQLQFRTRRQVSDVLSGAYLSVFKGSGIEFDEVRPYVPGDDIRSIDWNVTARTGTPHIKRFVEERELSIMLLVDISSSQDFGLAGRSKRETAAEISALIAFSAIANKDKVGLILFDSETQCFIPPRKGQKHALRVVREIIAEHRKAEHTKKDPWYRKWFHFLWKEKQKGRETDIASALEFCHQTLVRKSIIFVVSDYIDQGYISTMKRVHQKHDVVAIRIIDQAELELPNLGLLRLEDAETGQCIELDSSSPRFQAKWKASNQNRERQLEQQFANSGIDVISLTQDTDTLTELLRFLRMRERRGGR